MTDKIQISGVGPIEGEFSYELSGPGFYQLCGGHGTGKSTTLLGLDMLAGHKVDLTLNDDVLTGKVEGFGRVAPVGSRRRAKNELSVDTIDSSRVSLADLIRPDGKTAATRDKQRLTALAAVTGVTLSAMDRSGKRHQVATHVHEEDGEEHTPSSDYMAIIVAGGRYWQLPAGWIAGLEEYVTG